MLAVTDLATAAALLGLAVLVAPPPPRRRLAGLAYPQRTFPRAAPAAAAGVTLLGFAAVRGVLTVPVAVAGGLAAITIAARRRRLRRRRCRRKQGRALADALEILVGEVGVGADPVRAFAVAASESGGALGSALRAVAARARLGADVADGMRVIASDSPVGGYWIRLAACWELAATHGLPMSVLLRAAQRDITDRQRFTDRMDASLAGARATAVILACLPALGVLLGQLIGAHPVRFLLAGQPGGWLLVIGTALLCAGILWSDRIIEGFAR